MKNIAKKHLCILRYIFRGHPQRIIGDGLYEKKTLVKSINYFTKKSSLTHSTETPTFSNEIVSYSKTTDNVVQYRHYLTILIHSQVHLLLILVGHVRMTNYALK